MWSPFNYFLVKKKIRQFQWHQLTHIFKKNKNWCPANVKQLPWSHIQLELLQYWIHIMLQCFQGSFPAPLSFSSLLLMMPYSTAMSRQCWAIFETGCAVASPPFARTEIISRASLSMSVSARLFSASIMFCTMTTPRWRRSAISLSSRACRISIQWVVWEECKRKSHWPRQRKELLWYCECGADVDSARPLKWSAYCSRDASTQLRLLSGQHGQCSCSSFPQPLVVLSTVEHEQLQTIIPCGQVQLLHLRT